MNPQLPLYPFAINPLLQTAAPGNQWSTFYRLVLPFLEFHIN